MIRSAEGRICEPREMAHEIAETEGLYGTKIGRRNGSSLTSATDRFTHRRSKSPQFPLSCDFEQIHAVAPIGSSVLEVRCDTPAAHR